jgi:hypothetical protein
VIATGRRQLPDFSRVTGKSETGRYRHVPQPLISAEFLAILEMNTNHACRSKCRWAFFFGATKMIDAKILTLVDRLERCLLAKEEFHHRDHLTVAVVYLYVCDLEMAMDRMRSSLRRFAAHHGVTGLYHETLTRFWLLQVEKRLDRNLCLEQAVGKVREQLNDKNLVFEYYSRERIESKEAKESWLSPDLEGRR